MKAKHLSAAIALLAVFFTSTACSAGFFDTVRTAYSIWDVQTINDILHGQVVIPETTINDYLEKSMQSKDNTKYQDIKKLEIFIHKDNIMEIHADTKSSGNVVIKTKLRTLVHNKTESVMVLRVVDTKIKDGSLAAAVTNLALNIFTVEMCTKFFGQGVNFKDGIKTEIDGNTITVNFREWLYNNPIAAKKIQGYSVLDMLEIKEGITDEHVLKVKCGLDIPPAVQSYLLAILGLGAGDANASSQPSNTADTSPQQSSEAEPQK